ncbi:MAG: MauE/DoxX family redox-associated membrane protein [Geminicoccaceae bacterium]
MFLVDALALGLALVFLVGAWMKLADRADFALAVEAYDLLPERLVPTAVLALPVVELLAALLLPWQATRAVGLLLGALVLVGVTAGVAINLLRGRTIIDCGCGGLSGRQPISWLLVMRNLGLMAVLAIVAMAPSTPLDAMGVVGGGVAFLLLYSALDRILANRLMFRAAGWIA